MLVVVCNNALPQADTSKNDLRLDIGITRGSNINIWPVFNKFKNPEKKELQILYPFISKEINYKIRSKHIQVLPLFISDSSILNSDKRIFSTFYPSVLRFQKQIRHADTIRKFRFMELAPYISLFGLSRSAKGIYIENNLFFFIWYKHDSLINRTRLTVFPLYRYSSDISSTQHLLLPVFYSFKSDYKKQLNIALLFGSRKTSDINHHHLFPLWFSTNKYYSYDTVKNRTFFPFYWSRKNNETDNTVIFPFVYSIKNSYYRSLTVFPIFSKGNSYDLKSNHFVILPFYLYSKTQEYLSEIYFPLWWKSKDYLTNDTICHRTFFPLYWSYRSKAVKNDVFLPVLFNHIDTEKHSLTIVPVFSYSKNFTDNTGHFAITPLFWHFNYLHARQDVLFPVLWSKRVFRDNDTVRNMTIFPIYWSSHGRYKNNKIILPLVFSLRDTTYRSLTILPLLSAGHSPDFKEKHFDIIPVYWYLKNKESRVSVIFPLWWNISEFTLNDTFNKKSLFPVYWSFRNKSNSTDIIFPLIYNIKNQNSHSFTVVPLFSSGHSIDNSSAYFSITPLYWHFKRSYGKNDILFPLYWRTKRYLNNDTITKNTVFPLYWSTVSSTKNNRVFFPLVYSYNNQKRKSLMVLPLFSRGRSLESDKSHFSVTPLYWHFNRLNNKKDIVFPVFWMNRKFFKYDTTTNITLFPIFWSTQSNYRNNKVLFPFVYCFTKPNHNSLTVFPFFSFARHLKDNTGYNAITPFYWHFDNPYSKLDLIFPIFWRNIKYPGNDTTVTTTVFPVFWSKTSDKSNYNILFPLIWDLRNKNYSSFTFFPLFSYGHNTYRSDRYFMITPLAGVFRSPLKTNAFIFPLFNYRDNPEETHSSVLLFLYRRTVKADYSKTSVLWPICVSIKKANYKYFRLTPVIWYEKTDTSRMISVQPFQYSYKSESKKKFILSWFLYKYENIYGVSVSNNILWKLYTNERFTNGDFETRFLYRVYANIKNEKKREISVLPFYSKVKYSNGDRSVSAFFGFYNYFKQYIPEIKEYYVEDRVFWFIRLRSNYDKLKREGKDKFLK